METTATGELELDDFRTEDSKYNGSDDFLDMERGTVKGIRVEVQKTTDGI